MSSVFGTPDLMLWKCNASKAAGTAECCYSDSTAWGSDGKSLTQKGVLGRSLPSKHGSVSKASQSKTPAMPANIALRSMSTQAQCAYVWLRCLMAPQHRPGCNHSGNTNGTQPASQHAVIIKPPAHEKHQQGNRSRQRCLQGYLV